jgi:hypothetical protein
MKRKHSLWVWGLALFFFLAVFDGALRKWVMPSQSLALFLLKDIVLAGTFAFFMLNYSPTRLPNPVDNTILPLLLSIYIYIVLLQTFNLAQPNVAVRVLGLKSHLAYLPLVVMLPVVLSKLKRWKPEHLVLGYMGLVAVPVMLVGIYQFSQPATSWVNQYVAATDYVATVGGRPRVTGTFSYIAGMTSFMLFNTLLGFGIVVGGLMNRRHRLTLFGVVFLALCLVVLPMSGSRGPVYFAVLLIGAISTLLLVRRRGGRVVLIGMLLAATVAGFVLTQTNLGEGWTALQERIETTDDEERRIEGMILGPIWGIEHAGFFGYGVGSLHQAAPRLVPGASSASSWVPAGYVENATMRLIYELGSLGWLILVTLKIYVVWMGFRVLQRAVSPFEFVVATTSLGEGLQHVLGPVVFVTTTGIIYWSVVGLLIFTWSYQETREAINLNLFAYRKTS